MRFINIFKIWIILIQFSVLMAQKSFKPENYVIVYNIHVPDTTKDDWEMIQMNWDGSSAKNITNNKDVAWTYHANQKKLFFISDRDTSYRCFFLYTCEADGKNVKKISNLQLEDSWMSSRKNGDELIVSGRIGKTIRYQLFIIQTKTGKYQQITNDTTALFMDPCFSPDGKKIVCSIKKDKRNKAVHEELYLMNADGTDQKQLTHYPKDNISAKGYGYKAGSARWHPTDNFISYVSFQDGKNSIFAVSVDGQKHWKLLKNSVSEGWHDWSPDGKWLITNTSDIEEKQYHISRFSWPEQKQEILTEPIYKSQLCPVFLEK